MILYAFLVGLVLVVAATVYAAIRGVELWRQAKRTGGLFTAELSLFDERTARTEELLADAERSSRELEAATARLRASRAQLEVLLGALEGAQRRTRWLRAFMPSR